MGNLPPFEDRAAYGGFFPALLKTWVDACFHPMEFFDRVGNGQDLTPALLFGVLIGWISILFGALWGALFQLPYDLSPEEALILIAGLLCCFGVFGWVLALLGILISGLLLHLFLMLFGGAKQGLVMTLRVVSYAQAPALFGVIPFIGGCIGSVWGIVLYVIGLAAAHRTDAWRAVLAVVVAPILVCGFLLGLLVAIYFVLRSP